MDDHLFLRSNLSQALQIFASYWLLLSIMFIIQSVRLHLLEKLNPTTMENSKYPSSDWFLDNVVMARRVLWFN